MGELESIAISRCVFAECLQTENIHFIRIVDFGASICVTFGGDEIAQHASRPLRVEFDESTDWLVGETKAKTLGARWEPHIPRTPKHEWMDGWVVWLG